jgi:hypothetical protein
MHIMITMLAVDIDIGAGIRPFVYGAALFFLTVGIAFMAAARRCYRSGESSAGTLAVVFALPLLALGLFIIAAELFLNHDQ